MDSWHDATLFLLARLASTVPTGNDSSQERHAAGIGCIIAPARISHTRCGLRRFKKPTGQEPRAVRSGGSDKRATHPVGFFNRPFGLPFAGHLQRRAAQPYGPIRFRRPTPYLPRRKSNAGRMECEKCGLRPEC